MWRLLVVLGAAALAWCLLANVAAPRPAQAFVGQDLVVDGAGKLTAAAETLLKQGKTIPEIVAEAKAAGEVGGGLTGGAAGASGAASVFEAGAVVPVLGSVLAFGAGVGIGSEICHVLGIDGCWFYDNDGAEVVPKGGQWVSVGAPAPNASALAGTPPAFAWYWAPTGFAAGEIFAWNGYGGYVVGGLEPPGSESGFNATTETFEGGKHRGNLYRYSLGQGRSLTYSATDDGGVPNFAYSPPADWSERMADALTAPGSVGADPTLAPKVGQALAHRLDGSVPDPLATEGLVPNCGGLTYAQCAAKLEGEGLVPVKNTLGWEAAVLAVGPDVVTQLAPAAGTKQVVGTSVVVTVNPAEAGMPVLVPEPEAHETYDHYVSRVPAALVPHRQTVPEAQIVPDAGPDAVLEVTPEPETRADPQGETDLNVRTNPHDAPPIGGAGGGGGTCNAGIGAIDWTPLNKPLGNKFPFGVFGFFVGWIQEWEAGEGTPPNWSFTLVPSGVFGSDGMEVHVDLAFLGPMVSVCRVVFLFAAFVGLLWFLGTAAAKLQGDSS